jgi:hypothetical protein
VGTTHDFTLHVYGLKLEMDPSVDDPQQQTPYIDTDSPGRSYDGIIDAYDAEYFGGIFLVNADEASQYAEDGGYWVTVQGRDLWVDTTSGITQYDWNDDGSLEDFEGQTGIYLPLAGKDVTFDLANESGPDLSNLGEFFDGMEVDAVGSFTPDSAVTDENGEATVTVTSNEKGPETIEATVDWEHNPHNMSELLQAYAKKGWYAEDAVKIVVSIDETVVADNVSGEIATPINPMYVPDIDGFPVPNSAHIEVHVYDQFGNDLPDYEVVYLLENVGTTLNSGGQMVDATYLPNAYFADLDETDTVDGVDYDMNGSAPDADEPTPDSDPYATIVGAGGTGAFYFNQWLGAAVPGSLTADRKNTDYGHTGWVRGDITDLDITRALADIDFNAGLFFNYPFAGLMTDGAKAWTLDGYVDLGEGLVPNEHTGSHVDVQLAEYPDEVSEAGHFKSIVKVMVYAPADGVVVDQTPIWHYQVHKVWEAPVVTDIVLTPASDVNMLTEDHTVTATVYDQFGQTMANVDVYFWGEATEGGGPYDGGYPATEWPTNPSTTDANGVATATGMAVDWSNWNIWAEADGVTSNTVTKYWAMEWDGISALADSVTLAAGLGSDYDGKAFNVRKFTYDGVIVGSGTYNDATGRTVSTSSWHVDGDLYWIEWPGMSLTDDNANWLYYVPLPVIN